MLCVVSVVDSIATTSMPVNEFVIFRSMNNYEMHQIMIVCDTKAPEDVEIPKDVEVYLVGNCFRKIRKLVSRINKEYKGNIVYHLHHQKSAMIFLFATIFQGVKRHTLYTVHSTFSGRNLKYKISSCLCVLMSRYANCVSKASYQEYSGIVKKVKGNHFIAIPNGVDFNRIDDIIDFDSNQRDRKTLICVGRMIPLKNHAFLIRLMKYLPEYRLILIGVEDKEGKIRALTKEEGVEDRIEFKGLIPRDEVFKELEKSSIYLSSSLVEGLPVSVLEAMRAGNLPILSDILPHKEITEHCDEVIVLPLNEVKWVEIIKQLSELPYEEFTAITDKIKTSVQEQFSLKKMHEKYYLIYKELI
jgi:glycosyltransferase involved in cell wall biosynthesis